MEKLPMCRICLAENVRMYAVVNRNLHNLYEKLTDIPFVTEDIRPILACFFCCTKLKQCYQLLRQCLKAEELFTQRMNEDYETNSLINQNHLEFFSGFIISPIMHISIVEECQTESIAIKEELPAVCEGLNVIIEPKEELQSDELEPDLDNSCVDVADIPPHHSESDSEDDVPLMTFKTVVEEEQEVSQKKRTVKETTRATVATKPNLETLKTKLEDAITAEQTKKENSNTQDIRVTQIGASNRGTYLIEPYKYDQRNFNQVKSYIRRSPQIGEKHKCGVCQRSFSEKGNLIKHIRIHTGENPYKCYVCQQSFNVKISLTKHIRKHTGEKPYECDVCQSSFREKAHLTKHIRIHTVDKPNEKPYYKCGLCQHSFRQKGNLINHIRIHTGEKPYKCKVCQRSFREKAHLTKHIRIHTGEKPYKCDVCQRSFREKTHLTNHIRIHTGEKPYKCVVCECGFSTKSNLTYHTRIHSGENPYKCDVCQRGFRIKSQLTDHTRIHTGEKPYKCVVCQRGFNIKSNLTYHTRIHSSEKPYKCDVCQRGFRIKTQLTDHTRIHSGEKPYKCVV